MNRLKPVAGLMIALIAGSVLAGPAAAKSATEIRREAIERREADQAASIAAGRRDGGLTWWEKLRLQREQRRIDKLEAQALEDGKITKREYRDLRAAQNGASHHISSERHDQQVRGWWWRTFAR